MDKQYFLTGIGTGVGKTIAAAALAKYWGANYWKPIQSGDLDSSDSMLVAELAGPGVHIYPEVHRFSVPASPHYSARLEGVAITLADFQLPQTNGDLIVEGAGGLLVPINEREFIIDLIAHLGLAVILVCSDYLGSINHSLLSIESLKARGIPVAYLLLNGEANASTRAILRENKPVESKIITLPKLAAITQQGLEKALEELKIEQ